MTQRETTPGTVVIDPEIRLNLLRCCWAMPDDMAQRERDEAAAGVVDIHTGRTAIAGCYPVGVPLYLVAADLRVSQDDMLLAATEAVKLGHLDGNPDVPLVIAHHVRATPAGLAWIRAHDAAASLRSPKPGKTT
jgi:hypothetical protein